jgi:hypothetical protein
VLFILIAVDRVRKGVTFLTAGAVATLKKTR